MLARQSADQPRLSIIDEDSDALPPLPTSPPTASHRPFSRRWRDRPPAVYHDNSPPKYSVWDVSGPRGEKLMDMRNNKYIVRRGGWKRLCLVLLVLAIIAIALGVGLGVGLRRNRNGDSSAPSASDDSKRTAPFPVGTYSFETYLDVVSTKCTANAATWRCYPYTTYEASETQSLSIFDWAINGTPSNLTISSSSNPFAISFTNTSLSLVDADTPNERYSFALSLDKTVFPASPITSDNSNAACYFNGTSFIAFLYTKRAKDDQASTSNVTANSTSLSKWALWPYAVEVNQITSGGNDVPSCYETENGSSGSRITTGLAVQPTQDLCECRWRNFEL